MQARGEIARGFLVPCGDTSEMLDELKETFDQIAFPVEREIAVAFVRAIRLWRDDRLDRARPEASDVDVGVVALVGQDGFRLDLCGQRFGLGDVGDLATGQTEYKRISEGVDDHMDFRSQAAARTAYGLRDALRLARPGAVLMRADDRGVDHRVLVVGIICQRFEKTLPNPAGGPARETRVNVLPSTEARRHVAPRNALPEFPDHGLYEKLVASFAVAPDMSGTARQQVFDPSEFVVAQSLTVHQQALERRLPMNHAFPDLRIPRPEPIFFTHDE